MSIINLLLMLLAIGAGAWLGKWFMHRHSGG